MSPSINKTIPWIAAGLAMASALLFAIYTDHRWEDWYITFRASKNLAEGVGFTYNLGERIHSFTSPLGTLIPALLYYITWNDEAVIWLFRVVNILLLGTAAKLVFSMFFDKLKAPLWLAFLITLLLVFDGKSMDFSINGMETAFMLLGIVLFIRELFRDSMPNPLRIGLIWAFLMWSRPDAFIHIGSILVGYLLFKNRSLPYIRAFFRAAVIGVICYLPWLIFAWAYYGNPIPNTVLAKGSLTFSTIIDRALQYGQAIFTSLIDGDGPFIWIFAPAYFQTGGWPQLLMFALKWLSYLVVFLWAIPRVSANARFLSFAAFCIASYLIIFSPFIYPWYIPAVTIISVIALGCVLTQLATTTRGVASKSRPWVPAGIVAVVMAVQVWVYTGGLIQMKQQQELIEYGLRKEIGLWLKSEAQSNKETVFLEPLGYIGYYSGLTMYDYPGLGNKTMINARKKLGSESYIELVNYIQPDWVVVRPGELKTTKPEQTQSFESNYTLARSFDRKPTIESLSIYGRGFLRYDSQYMIYKKKQTDSKKIAYGR
ncbi:hypothetical protein [Telluribacter sp.]|jgi:hypothetical protein|uniref:hypothetical protein n=1 Tax=Telluribacter sp. TaxID=1978767 RepID=UPI002E0F28F2|nr:hypothetical protein [Telluribacter sp.]